MPENVVLFWFELSSQSGIAATAKYLQFLLEQHLQLAILLADVPHSHEMQNKKTENMT